MSSRQPARPPICYYISILLYTYILNILYIYTIYIIYSTIYLYSIYKFYTLLLGQSDSGSVRFLRAGPLIFLKFVLMFFALYITACLFVCLFESIKNSKKL